jgi:hypothetical protein
MPPADRSARSAAGPAGAGSARPFPVSSRATDRPEARIRILHGVPPRSGI